MEKYIHNILENDDPDIIECKDEYNETLINNAEFQIFHKTMELETTCKNNILDAKIDADKLEDMKKNYDPSSEEIFNTIWDLTEEQDIHLEFDDNNGDKIVKSL